MLFASPLPSTPPACGGVWVRPKVWLRVFEGVLREHLICLLRLHHQGLRLRAGLCECSPSMALGVGNILVGLLIQHHHALCLHAGIAYVYES